MLFAAECHMISLRGDDIPVGSAAFKYGYKFAHRLWATLDQ